MVRSKLTTDSVSHWYENQSDYAIHVMVMWSSPWSLFLAVFTGRLASHLPLWAWTSLRLKEALPITVSFPQFLFQLDPDPNDCHKHGKVHQSIHIRSRDANLFIPSYTLTTLPFEYAGFVLHCREPPSSSTPAMLTLPHMDPACQRPAHRRDPLRSSR